MKIKKFKQFLNLNEELDLEEEESNKPESEFLDDTEFDNIADLRSQIGDDGFDSDDINDNINNAEEDLDNLQNNIDNSDNTEEEEGEGQESYEYKGSLLLQELADKLGAEVSDNQINYNGKTINFYSETERFHIGKDKFDSIEEVLDFLNVGADNDTVDNITEEELNNSDVLESRRYIKKFNS